MYLIKDVGQTSYLNRYFGYAPTVVTHTPLTYFYQEHEVAALKKRIFTTLHNAQ